MERREGKMRGATIAAALLVSFSYISVSPSSAEPTPSPSPSVALDPYKAALEQFKHDRDLFMTALRDRANKIHDINLVFKSSIDKANADARSALASATTPLQKSTISAARRNAIDTAINARDTSIAALGEMPVPPTEPVRPPKTMGNNESKGSQKR
jgi:hypothetical protein